MIMLMKFGYYFGFEIEKNRILNQKLTDFMHKSKKFDFERNLLTFLADC